MYRQLASIDPRYTFRLGAKVRVINNESSFAEIGQVGIIVGDCNYPGHPGYPTPGWIVKFSKWSFISIFINEQHFFQFQLELI